MVSKLKVLDSSPLARFRAAPSGLRLNQKPLSCKNRTGLGVVIVICLRGRKHLKVGRM
jgi:hypothetical protein